MNEDGPLVSIVTPVFNGEKYLGECIESVLAQTYQNWEYAIVDNCSTDSTLKIAEEYARKDKRIQVHSYDKFVSVIESYNRALRVISPSSKYCKVVSADDWINSDCLIEMVRVAEAHPTVAIVGSYQRKGDKVICMGLPASIERFSGRDVCRLSLLSLVSLNPLGAFGDQTSTLYRSDVVRTHDPFYPHLSPYADTTSCYKYLQFYDFGFVHSVLSSMRVHNDQITSKVALAYDMNLAGSLEHITQYGPVYLDKAELESIKDQFIHQYYKHLGACLLQLNFDRGYWTYHISKMNEMGCPFLLRKVMKGLVNEIVEELRDPKIALSKFVRVLQKKFVGAL